MYKINPTGKTDEDITKTTPVPEIVGNNERIEAIKIEPIYPRNNGQKKYNL